LGRLDAEAVARVQGEAWPDAANPDELHDALVWLGFLSPSEIAAGEGWREWLSQLSEDRRAAKLHLNGFPAKAGTHSSTTQTPAEMGPGRSLSSGRPEAGPVGRDLESTRPTAFWVAAERLPQFLALWPH